MSSPYPRPWHRNLLIVVVMLAIWLAVTIMPVWFAEAFEGQGSPWPRAYWVAAYGAPLVYLALVGMYAWLMRADGSRR